MNQSWVSIVEGSKKNLQSSLNANSPMFQPPSQHANSVHQRMYLHPNQMELEQYVLNISQHALLLEQKIKQYESYKMFVFSDVFSSYTPGIAFTIARTKEEAIDQIIYQINKEKKMKDDNNKFWDDVNTQISSTGFTSFNLDDYEKMAPPLPENGNSFGVWRPDPFWLNETSEEEQIYQILSQAMVVAYPLNQPSAFFCGGGD